MSEHRKLHNLTDTDSHSFDGVNPLDVLRVNSTGTALEYAAIGGGSDKNYIHNQAAPLAVWNVTHGLNKFCSVTVIDTSNRVVEGDIEYIDINNVQITFSSPVVGKAYFN